MPERNILSRWLDGTPWADWSETPLAGDASSRCYSRLTGPDGATAIAMTDPSGPEAIARFVRVADALTAKGLSAPRLLLHAANEGRAIITDMGPQTVADVMSRTPEQAISIYDAITDLMVVMHSGTPPAWLTPITPERAAQMIAPLSDDYAPGFDSGPVQGELATLLAAQTTRHVFTHRDFHVENMIWRSAREGVDRIGLLDFQDAVAAPPAYDLASLIRDARRDVPPDTAQYILGSYAEKSGHRLTDLTLAAAIWGVQRNLRILGVFAALGRSGKPGYEKLMPRVWENMQADLTHPALEGLAHALRNLPPPEARAR